MNQGQQSLAKQIADHQPAVQAGHQQRQAEQQSNRGEADGDDQQGDYGHTDDHRAQPDAQARGKRAAGRLSHGLRMLRQQHEYQ